MRIRILNADPDPGDKMNADPCGSGSEALGLSLRTLSGYQSSEGLNLRYYNTTHYGSGSPKITRARPAPKHCYDMKLTSETQEILPLL